MMVRLRKVIPTILMYSVAFIPLIGLLWEQDLGGLKLNWIIYPFILLAVIFIAVLRNALDRRFLYFSILIILYAIIIIPFEESLEHIEHIARIFFSFLPLFFLKQIGETQTNRNMRIALIIYFLCITVPITIGALQYFGYVPFRDYDTVAGENIGRMSGGYSKPNNFVMFILPLFLLGIELRKTRKLLSVIFLSISLIFVYLTGLRISLIIYGAILAFLLWRQLLVSLIKFYYKYYLNFFIGIITFIFTYLIFKSYGFIDVFRGRFELWEIHSKEFFSSNFLQIIFGKGKILLDNPYLLIDEGHFPNILKDRIYVLNEIHNDSFRIIVVFGILGYFLYATLIRYFALESLKRTSGTMDKYIVAACFLSYILYSITNEPTFYPAIFWCTFFWLFIKAPKRDYN